MECMAIMDGIAITGMMVWSLLSMLLGLVILFLFILSAAYGVKWVWGQTQLSTTAHGECALIFLKSAMREAKSVRGIQRVEREIE